MDKVYDIIVLGAGPAGLTAASYAGRARMDTLLIEQKTADKSLSPTKSRTIQAPWKKNPARP